MVQLTIIHTLVYPRDSKLVHETYCEYATVFELKFEGDVVWVLSLMLMRCKSVPLNEFPVLDADSFTVNNTVISTYILSTRVFVLTR